MLLLRIFLYTICCLCLTWGAILFSGPIILKKIIGTYSNGQVVASGITVTPDLNIKIGRIEYSLKVSEGHGYRQGFSRSINISWSIFGQQPLMEAQIGPTILENTFVADGLTIYTPPFSEIAFREIPLVAGIRNLVIQSVANIEELQMKAIYSGDDNSLSDVSLDLVSADFNALASWDLVGARANVDYVDLKMPIDKQKLEVKLTTEQIENSKRNVKLVKSEGFFNVFGEELDFDFDLQDFSFGSLEHLLPEVNVKGAYTKNGRLKLSLMEILDDSDLSVSDRKPQIVFVVSSPKTGIYDVKIIGDLGSRDLIFGENFIGTLPANTLKIELRIDSNALSATAASEIIFKNLDVPVIVGDGELSLQLADSEDIFECKIFGCEIISADINVNMDIGQQWVSGKSTCYSAPCQFSSMSHRLKTSNTRELLQIINRSKVLNPLYTAYLYALLSGGKKNDNGHEVLLN